jgi:S1-C subfamily serine protease
MNNDNISHSKFKTFILAALALGLGLGGGFVIGNQFAGPKSTAGSFPTISNTRGKISSTNSYAPAVTNASAAVVNVFSEKTIKQNSMLELFLDDLSDEGFSIPPERLRQRSLGSGVVISPDGYILTNSHVIKGADKISITLTTGKEFKAKVVGFDSKTDLALIKAEGSNWPFIPFTDSDKVQIGDVVLAIGNPFGIGQTVTMGIVSATKRENLGLLDYEDFIQTDAAINPGNSGGALIDSQGNLIGINTAIFSKSGGYQGIGFAVPSSLAKKIADELKSSGKIKRSYLGLSVIGLNEQPGPVTGYFLQRGYEDGALVVKVQPNGPSDNAGVKEGALITKINNSPIKGPEALFKIIAQSPSDKPIDIEADVLNLETGKITKENYSVKPGTT